MAPRCWPLLDDVDKLSRKPWTAVGYLSDAKSATPSCEKRDTTLADTRRLVLPTLARNRRPVIAPRAGKTKPGAVAGSVGWASGAARRRIRRALAELLGHGHSSAEGSCAGQCSQNSGQGSQPWEVSTVMQRPRSGWYDTA